MKKKPNKYMLDFLENNLDIESIQKFQNNYFKNIKSQQEKDDILNKKISSLEKELKIAKSLKEQIEIIQIKTYISMKEVQIYIGKSRSWINDQILNNNFPTGSKSSSKENMFKRESIDKWIDEIYYES